MPFTVNSFPNRIFKTHQEFEEALFERDKVERSLELKAGVTDNVSKVTARIIPASKELLNLKVIELESKIEKLHDLVATFKLDAPEKDNPLNQDGLKVGSILQGESKGESYTLEVLKKGYLCSDGNEYNTLSAAAMGVSGNRRSGWKFWKDLDGDPIGETTGRFKSYAKDNPFAQE